MNKNLLFVAAFMAALSVSAAQAQGTTTNQTSSVSQTNASAPPSADTSGYGGTRTQSASGAMTQVTGEHQLGCGGPASFCDLSRSH